MIKIEDQKLALMGYYFTQETPNSRLDYNNDKTVTISGDTKLENFVDIQQFVILYNLLAEYYQQNGNFETIFKCDDGYGILGPWSNEPLVVQDNTTLIETVINTKQKIKNVMRKSINTLFAHIKNDNLNASDLFSTLIIIKTDFIHALFTEDDFKKQISKIIDLGFHDNYFKFNKQVEQALTQWLKDYPQSIINEYYVLVNNNPNDKRRVLVKRDEFHYIQDASDDELNNLLTDLTNPTNQNYTYPLWLIYEPIKHKFIIDPNKNNN